MSKTGTLSSFPSRFLVHLSFSIWEYLNTLKGVVVWCFEDRKVQCDQTGWAVGMYVCTDMDDSPAEGKAPLGSSTLRAISAHNLYVLEC